MNLTADTITDEQIRELRSNLVEWFDGGPSVWDPIAVECGIALAKFRDPVGVSSRNRARARCAEILNARAKEGC